MSGEKRDPRGTCLGVPLAGSGRRDKNGETARGQAAAGTGAWAWPAGGGVRCYCAESRGITHLKLFGVCRVDFTSAEIQTHVGGLPGSGPVDGTAPVP